jgi:hypothetical protein
MNANAAVVVVTLTIAACSAEPRGVPQSETGIPGRVDSCDLRGITGTCLEYTMSELNEWYRENLARTCSVNRRGNLTGIYRQNLRCPKEHRVARCEDIVEDPTEEYEREQQSISRAVA